MFYSLTPHPDHSSLAVSGVAVEVRRGRDELRVIYRVAGTAELVMPAPRPPARTDELWRATCFELFVRFDDGERYVEFNFSPSTCWAAYAFDGYREGMARLDLPSAPVIERRTEGVSVALDLSALPHGELAMALTAVIEEEGGTKSYWSLAHPPGAPDFHHPACFAARLPAPDGP